jgi:hypothetical protein
MNSFVRQAGSQQYAPCFKVRKNNDFLGLYFNLLTLTATRKRNDKKKK